MPKAPATFSQDDEEEKTTIESGWEDEASTTVEQGEVAEKLRSHNGANGARSSTGITSTNGGALDEPTVDDQRANAALSLITPSVAPARIVVTAGNDKGQELEIRPGKTYTIGRAIDNDFVLTDIAVSRKHFDLRHENGTWIVVDRGSGNGTVINGNIEDQPFVLMNGDAIEIGNTSFRFDHANQPARQRNTGFTVDLDEEEPSTVAGKPLRSSEEQQLPPTPAHMLPPLPRPKTVPPPAPLPRPRSPSVGNQPQGYAGMNGARGSVPPMPSAAPIGQPIHQQHQQAPMQLGGPIGVPMASPTAPTVQPMQGMQAMRPPMGGPQAPTMLDQNGMMRPQMLHNNAHEPLPLPGVMPTTIPGQGPPVAPSQPQVPQFSYPGIGDIKPQLGQLQINGHMPPRDATSTALVQPVPYGMGQPLAPQQYGHMVAQPQPGISRRIKLLLGGALLMVLAAIATIAIIKSSSSSEKPKPSASEKGSSESSNTTKPTDTKKTTQDTKVVVADTTKKTTTDDVAKKLEDQKKADEAKKLEDQKKLDEQKKADDAKKLAEEQKKKADEQKKADEAKKLEAKKAADEQKKLDDAKRLEAKKVADEQRKREAEERAEELRQKRLEAQKKAEEEKRKRAEKAAERKKQQQDDKRNQTTVASREDDTSTTANAGAGPKNVPADTSTVKSKAEDLYRAKKFNDAAKLLRNAAASLGEADARDLRSVAAVYEQVGKAYNVGMGPATPPVDAFASLEKALNLDRPIGVFSEEIKAKLGQVAPKAAMKHMVAKSYEQAFKAVRVAEQFGGSNSTTSAVREGLLDAANTLYQEAMDEKSSNPQGARAKLARIKGMIDKGAVLVKAEKALRDIPSK